MQPVSSVCKYYALDMHHQARIQIPAHMVEDAKLAKPCSCPMKGSAALPVKLLVHAENRLELVTRGHDCQLTLQDTLLPILREATCHAACVIRQVLTDTAMPIPENMFRPAGLASP